MAHPGTPQTKPQAETKRLKSALKLSTTVLCTTKKKKGLKMANENIQKFADILYEADRTRDDIEPLTDIVSSLTTDDG